MNNFSTEDEVIDVEWAAQNDKLPPKGRKYRYKVDEVSFTTDKESLTGREILLNAGKKSPEQYILRQKVRGKWLTVKPDESVDFTTAGVEKFKTLPNDQTDGEKVKSPLRDFALLEEDEEFLNSLDLVWEAVVDSNNTRWIFIHDYSIVKGYNVDKAVLAICMVAGYPTAQLDMAFFSPALSRGDGQSIPNLSTVVIKGVSFQQWSRHRTPQNPWRPGIDNLGTHYPLAEAWLLNEFQKRPHYAVSA